VPLLVAAPRAASVRSAARLGWLFGFAAEFPAFLWLVRTIHVFGGFPSPLAIAFYLVLTAYGACQFGLFAAGLRWAGPRAPLLLAPALWTALEFLFPNLFPWRLGHSQRAVPLLLQIGDVTGPYGLSFAMVYLAAALARVRAGAQVLLGPVAVLAGLLAYGSLRASAIAAIVQATPPIRVGIVQGNLSLDEKRHADLFQQNVSRYQALSRALSPPPDLLVWPETVVEWGIPHDAPDLDSLDPLPGATTPLIFGAVSYRRLRASEPLRGGNAEWFNSAFLRSPEGRLTARYDKIILMPFGEFIPFASVFPWLKDLSPNTGDFTAGRGPVVLEVTPELRVAPLVCYEDLVAGLVRRSVRDGATVLLTLANLAWFGQGTALWQHETLALWRAIENRRYLVIATNTGLSSVIDPFGRVVASLPVGEATASAVEIHPLDVVSPYQRFGDSFGWSVVALTGLFLLLSKSR
jgi:apolipoprotein N-acyltransferase